MQANKKYFVFWKSNITGFGGHGEPVNWRIANAWRFYGNLEYYPNLYYWTEPYWHGLIYSVCLRFVQITHLLIDGRNYDEAGPASDTKEQSD